MDGIAIQTAAYVGVHACVWCGGHSRLMSVPESMTHNLRLPGSIFMLGMDKLFSL